MVVEPRREGQETETVVLCSSGLDSAVLLAHEARDSSVLPVYVSVGFAWEPAERAMLERLLAAPVYTGRVQTLVALESSVRDVYPATHWAIGGTPPAYDTPDSDVYLMGRNLVLLAKIAILCVRQRVSRVALGPLAGNPFPDARPEFFSAISHALSLGMAHPIEIVGPFVNFHKADVIRLGRELGVPFELTLSCMNPSGGLHCGQCSKCRERRDAFAEVGTVDPAEYLAAGPT